MRAKYDKWLVLIPFLCYPAIFLISAEIAVYGGWKSHATLTPLAKQDCPPLATI